MSSYRPICDTWILARPKVAYYGAYPNGFLERARNLLGVGLEDTLLHVCSGKVREYPIYGGFGPNDVTMDLDQDLEPDIVHDAREPFPSMKRSQGVMEITHGFGPVDMPWPAILIDPPYEPVHADHYKPGRLALPSANLLLKNGLNAVRPGGRVGVLHYIWPSPPKDLLVRLVATITVLMGYNNRARIYSVYERKVVRNAGDKNFQDASSAAVRRNPPASGDAG